MPRKKNTPDKPMYHRSRPNKSRNINLNFRDIIVVLVVVLLAYVIGRQFGPCISNEQEISNIASILEVLVAVLAIIGFELFLQIQDALKKVDKFDDRLDRLENLVRPERINKIEEIEYMGRESRSKLEEMLNKHFKINEIANNYLQSLVDPEKIKGKDCHEIVIILLSNAAKVFSYAQRVFQIYFDDLNLTIDEGKFNEVLNGVEFFKGTASEGSLMPYCDLLEIRIDIANERIERWNTLKGRIDERLDNYAYADDREVKRLENRLNHIKEKIEKEKIILTELINVYRELERRKKFPV